jgi:hypothetical protein
VPASAVASTIAMSVASKGKSCTSTLVTMTSVFNGWDGVDPATLAGFDPAALERLSMLAELRRQRVPVVLDTSCVRTGLHSQLAQGRVPATLHLAESDKARLFMEKDTLVETWERLPRFADQMGVPLSRLRSLFGDHWLPLISVVSLSDALRKVDPRATAVLARDPDDYPTAALAALLSPCILLTRNHKDFAPLGVRTPTQGVDAILAVIEVRAGETQLQAVAVLPAAPVLAVGGVTKWAADRVGPVVYVILAVLVGKHSGPALSRCRTRRRACTEADDRPPLRAQPWRARQVLVPSRGGPRRPRGRVLDQAVRGGIHASPRNNWARTSSPPTPCLRAVAR